MPLQHELIPNMEANVWPSYSDPGPYYDLEWNYTRAVHDLHLGRGVPPRPRERRRGCAAQAWDTLWNPDYAGAISLYDSYGDTIAVAILRNGSLEVNTGDPAADRCRQGRDPARPSTNTRLA